MGKKKKNLPLLKREVLSLSSKKVYYFFKKLKYSRFTILSQFQRHSKVIPLYIFCQFFFHYKLSQDVKYSSLGGGGSCSVYQLCLTLCNPSQPSLSVDFPGKNTGMGCNFLLQGIFQAQGLNPYFLHLLHWQADSLITEQPWKPNSSLCQSVNPYYLSILYIAVCIC